MLFFGKNKCFLKKHVDKFDQKVYIKNEILTKKGDLNLEKCLFAKEAERNYNIECCFFGLSLYLFTGGHLRPLHKSFYLFAECCWADCSHPASGLESKQKKKTS